MTAESQHIFQRQAADYRYKIYIQNPSSKWEVGYGSDTHIINENEKNKRHLEMYKQNVDEMHFQRIELILDISLFALLLTFSYYLWKRKRLTTPLLALIIFVYSAFTCVKIIQGALEFRSAYGEAKTQYQILK
ncbi:hypothetical protein V1498_13905 [Peribacillus sp. SCS-26]|uniref:hypothetical protein n=1 Tax=Paraperibacillus marinus TaxID=3115295 RepID=UPI0039059032